MTLLRKNWHTCDPRSAVVKALELGGGVYYVARGEDVDAGGNILAIITTTIILLFVHFEICKIPRCLIFWWAGRGEAKLRGDRSALLGQ